MPFFVPVPVPSYLQSLTHSLTGIYQLNFKEFGVVLVANLEITNK